METWKTVVGWEGLYEVSDLGSVRSLDRRVATRGGTRIVRGRLLKPVVQPYPMVSLWDAKTDRSRRVAVHRLVLEAFRGPCPVGMVARHGNGTATDCALSNLTWSTQLENISDKARHGTLVRGVMHHKVTISEADVRAIRASAETSTVLAQRYGVLAGSIRAIRRRRTWRHVE